MFPIRECVKKQPHTDDAQLQRQMKKVSFLSSADQAVNREKNDEYGAFTFTG